MRNLLIVDDEKNIRFGLKMMIEREFPEAYDIRMASQGEEALQLLRAQPADIVITDIRMPVMDGIRLIESLAELEGTGAAKPVVLILSGYEDFEYAKAAIRYQVKEYLLKPIRREELFAALRKTEEALIRQAEVDSRMAATDVYLQQLQSHRLKELLEQPEDTDIDLAAAAESIGFEAYVKPFRVAVMKYKYEDGNTMNKDELKQLVEKMMESVEGRISASVLDGRGGSCWSAVPMGSSRSWRGSLRSGRWTDYSSASAGKAPGSRMSGSATIRRSSRSATPSFNRTSG